MSLLARARKGLDQAALAAEPYGGTYIPLENHRTWTEWGVTSGAGMNYIAVYQCVRVLANTFGMLPLKLYRRRDDQGKDPATDHPLYRTLHLAPNPTMTSYVWRKTAMRDVATWGNHYSEKIRDFLGDLQLWPIRPDRIEARWTTGGKEKEYRYHGPNGVTILSADRIFQMQGQTTDGLSGLSPVGELRVTLNLARSAERYAGSVFDNGARPATVLSHPKTMSTPAADRLTAQMDSLKGSGNAGKTVLLEEGLTVTPIGFPPEDAQFLDARLNQHRLIYGAYGIPPHKVGDLERATFSNIEHQSLEFIQDGMVPWLVNAEQEFAVQLIDEPDLFAEFSVDGYLRGDAKSRAEALAIRWQHGNLSPNEWRAKENDNPIEGGDAYYVPVNYKTTEEEPIEDLGPESTGERPENVIDFDPAASTRSGALRCAGDYRGSTCGQLLAELTTPPYRYTCRRCKTVTRADGPAVKSEPLEAILDSRPTVEIKLPDSFSVEVPPVRWEDMPERPAPVVEVKMDTYALALDELRAEVRAPRRKRIVRDENNVITEVVEETA